MILSGKRVVMFMDYNANQTAIPYILDEFSHMFETPYSPTNQSFPCTQQRPPGLKKEDAEENYMYLANHNLNTAIDVGAILGGGSTDELLVPNTAEMNLTNAEGNQFGRLGAMSLNCTSESCPPPLSHQNSASAIANRACAQAIGIVRRTSSSWITTTLGCPVRARCSRSRRKRTA